MPKAVFLDRDGVINKKLDNYVKSIKEFILHDKVPAAIRRLKENGFLVIVITNQSSINRGYLSHKELDKIHKYMKFQLEKSNCFVDAIYYCPHHPDENCSCRKPQPGMILQAIKDFSIIKESSWLIGDSESDIEAAKRAGVKAIKMKTDSSLLDSVNLILNQR